ncbi:hypothetical protein NP233_g6801 [Leucocoprinus birnbaumii]|uniref:Protein kinase domain-containing protein n=1 Tax=Leucocoprinus birnbaumii TaxID=56174 RepID=A0AAD5YV75_9AGAR|nr:hypothetical protein NP233_g6801 [Leucocoprinus birnbaumii]
MSLPGSRIANDIQGVEHRNLTGRVRLDTSSIYAKFSGGCSDIFIGTYSSEGAGTMNVAIKVLRISNTHDQENVVKIKTRLIRETTVWTTLNHPNILPFLGLDHSLGREGCPALISPFCQKGDIMAYLKTLLDPSGAVKLNMMTGIARGLQYLHGLQKKVIHGDLKPLTQILFPCSDEYSPGFTTRAAGVFRYQAPELLNDNSMRYNEPLDVYAFGITCSEIWTSKQPFAEVGGDAGVIMKILKGGRPENPNPRSALTTALWELLGKCWTPEPGDRISMSQAVGLFQAILAQS